MTLMTRPTPCAKRGGADDSSSPGGPSRGRISHRYSSPYGDFGRPRPAPMAKNNACTASSHALLVMRTTTKTIMVIRAPNRGPLGSIIIGCSSGGSCLAGWAPLARGGRRPADAKLGAAARRAGDGHRPPEPELTSGGGAGRIGRATDGGG